MNTKIVFFILLSIALLTNGLYEEDAGKRDWSRENIGALKIARVDAKSSLLYAATESNVIAALNAQTGEIVWRRVLNEKESIQSLRVFGDKLFTISGNQYIRAWSNKGVSLWDDVISSDNSLKLHFDVFENNFYVAVLSNQQVLLKNVENGATLWSFKTLDPFVMLHSIKPHGSTNIKIVALQSSSNNLLKNILIYTLNLVNGKEVQEKETISLLTDVALDNLSSVSLIGDNLVILDAASNTIVVVPLNGKSQIYETSKVALTRTSTMEQVQSANTFIVDKKLKVTVQDTLSQFLVQEDEFLLNVQDSAVAVATLAKSKDSFEFKGKSYKLVTGKRVVAAYQVHKTVVLHLEDSSLLGVQESLVLWTREEALASIVKSVFVDYPIRLEIPHEKAAISLTSRLAYQIHQVAQLFSGEKSQQKSKNTRDKYGFKKLIVSTTSIGKIFAQDTETGGIVWSLYYPEVFGAGVSTNGEVHVSSADPEADAELTITAFNKKTTFLATLNAITGQVINKETFEFRTLSTIAVASGKSVLLISEDDLSVHVYPRKSTLALEKQLTSVFFFHVINTGAGKITGYSFTLASKQAKQVWSTSFATRIVAVAEHSSPMNEHISSVVHLTGSGDVLHKYLNPHLFAVATLATTRVEESNQVQETKSIEVYLIESISGDVIYRATHPFSDAPISLALDENFLVYHYLNEKQKRFELSIVEMFTNDTSIEQSLVSAMLKIETRSPTFSVFGLERPFILRQSFVFPTAVNAIATTKTKLGITGKMIVFGLGSDQVFGVNKKLVDPRRPRGEATPADQEEGLLPYNPYVQFDAKQILSYNKTIHRLQKIESSPSTLESTSHIFARGLDQFYTRVTPSQSYDMLNDDFSHSLLLITAAGLLVLAFIVRKYAASREVYRQWA